LTSSSFIAERGLIAPFALLIHLIANKNWRKTPLEGLNFQKMKR
jgi:hypothetical protein